VNASLSGRQMAEAVVDASLLLQSVDAEQHEDVARLYAKEEFLMQDAKHSCEQSPTETGLVRCLTTAVS